MGQWDAIIQKEIERDNEERFILGAIADLANMHDRADALKQDIRNLADARRGRTS